MKSLAIIALLSMFTVQLYSQIITGKVVDSSNGEPLGYVSIGVINTSLGAITNEKGNFKIDVNGQSPKDIVRISMISFKPQTFTIEELSLKENTIKLIASPTQLAEVIVKPNGTSTEIGTNSYSWHGGFCGWGGTQFGKGNEIGTRIKLGTLAVRLKSLHIRLYKQSFDSSLFRLHIRTIANNLPLDELLNDNILIVVVKKSGWVDIDLSKYNLVFSGDIALTLEWVKVNGINTDRLITVNGFKGLNVLFNVKKGEGCTYVKWGVEAKWKLENNESPSFYVTVQ